MAACVNMRWKYMLLFAVSLLMTCLRWTSAADVPEGTVYVEVDGTAVLHPGSAHTSGHIRTVTWKYDGVIAAELYRSVIICFQKFKGRCELNTRTGELIITHLTLSDSGFYSVEINNIEVNTVQLWVISPVPKPSVSTWCDPPKTYCLLTCEGTSSLPESLQYRWKEENDWSHSMKVLKITKENKEPEFSCELKNPVSSSRSDPVQNPFITANLLWIIAVVLVILLIVIVAVVLYYKRKNISQKGEETAAPVCEVDGTAVLHPDSAHTGDIKTVTWKHNGYTAAVWYGENVSFNQQFEGRCELNTRTGKLSINHLTLSDNGRYSVEINNKETNTVQLQVMCKKTAEAEETVHVEVDDTAILHPGSAHTGNITKIIWKHNGHTAVAWYGKEVFFSQQFKGRCELNTRTGELTINHLTLSDRGFYSVEINGYEVNTVQLQVTSKKTAARGTVYAVDGTAVLHPGSAHTGNIRTVKWKHNGHTAAAWCEKKVFFLKQFEGRCELNTRTGELTINHLRLSDSGSYSVEINNIEVNTVQLWVMSKKTAAAGTVYEEVDGTAVLHPGSAHTGNTMTVKWKHNGYKAAAWYGANISFSREFEGRCELNTRTGELTIKHLTLSDSGRYSVDINGYKVNTVQLQVMSKKRAARVYEEVGGTAVLHPGSAHTGYMERVIWKHNSHRAVVWHGSDVFFCRQFKGRCELNTRTGKLTIKHLTLSDSGFYSAEINGKKNSAVQLQVKSKKTAAAGKAGDEEEPGETTELLSQSGGVQQESRGDINYPPDVSPAVASWSPV